MRVFLYPLMGCLLLLAGCQTLAPRQADITRSASSVHQSDTVINAEQSGLSGLDAEAVSELLAAEIAGQRDRVDIALQRYLEQASRLQHPALAQRATYIAQYLQDTQAALDAVELWSEMAPQNVEAHRLSSTLLIQQGEFLEAFEHQSALLALKEKTHFAYLVAQSQHSEEAVRDELLLNLTALKAQAKDNVDILAAIAQLHIFSKHFEAAGTEIDAALALNPKQEQALILKAGVVTQTEGIEAGIKVLQTASQSVPNSMRIQLALARSYVNAERLDEAQAIFARLAEAHPQDGQMRLSLALVMMENGLQGQAEKELEKLIASQQQVDQAHFYLGRIHEQRKDLDGAIFHYQEVSAGAEFLQAHARATKLQIELGRVDDARVHLAQIRLAQPDIADQLYLLESEMLQGLGQAQEAYALLSEALEHDPLHEELLYQRAMVAFRLGRVVLMEQDLRQILEQDPNNATVLNTLGYTLTDYSERYSEALALVQKAFALKPGDPAIMDSLGWAYFRLQDYEQAVHYLTQAYRQMQDAEIVAHLIEVYWVMGRLAQAQQLLKEALQLYPEHELIQNLLQRIPELQATDSPSKTISPAVEAASEEVK